MDSESEFFTDDDGLDDFAATPHPAPALGMVMAALGVVYGDIGTSPLYAMQTVFNVDHGVVPATSSGVYGVVSLIFWSITAVVSIKYIVLVLRADNDGEGGVLALAALARRALSGGQAKRVALVTTLGLLGAALYWGDSVVTPAISVMSAVEGLGVANPSLRPAVLPIAVGVVVALFAVQRWGTARIGRLFGPSMLIWFLFLGVTGLAEVVRHPTILAGLSPHYAWLFVVSHPGAAFAALTGVVLVVTGAEALYADLGHFGAHAIRRAWFGIAFPALTLNYLAQGALILHNPAARRAPFYLLVPAAARLPATILATAATVIASQAVITGAFSLTRQAVRLGLLPYLAIHHTSEHERGQVFLPAINKGLLVAVLAVMIGFRSSGHLAAAYGLSVSGTFLTTSVLLVVVTLELWRWRRWQVALLGVTFASIETTYLAANFGKLDHGGWLPLLLATAIFSLMTTWRRGRDIVNNRRREAEEPLTQFVDRFVRAGALRVPGIAIFPHADPHTTPLALARNLAYNHVLHQQVVVVSVRTTNVPHVDPGRRITIEHPSKDLPGLTCVRACIGFLDRADLPEILRPVLADIGGGRTPASICYFLSRVVLYAGPHTEMSRLRTHMFIALAHNAASQVDYFQLPIDRTVVLGSQVIL